MNFCGVLAGGKGLRMGYNIPKQFLDLAGKPIIIHTISKIVNANIFDYIIIAVHTDYMVYLKTLLQQFKINSDRILIISGGNERIDSIDNVVSTAIKIDTSDNNIIMLHDAVRPFISNKIIKDSIVNARNYGACVAGVQAIDTIYQTNNEGFIEKFPNRNSIIYGQAPDTFKLNLLASALYSLTEDERKKITGTVQICALKNVKIKIIDGDYNNIKITNKNDLYLAENIMKEDIVDESLCIKS